VTKAADLPMDDHAGRRISRWILALVFAQALLSAGILGLGLVDSCGSCSKSTNLHPWIAGTGLVGYLVLLFLGWTGARRAFAVGVSGAAGIHAALVLWMFEKSSFCPPCLLGAAIAAILTVLCLRTRIGTLTHVERVSFPALLLAAGAAFGLSAFEDSQKAVRKPAVVSERPAPRVGEPIEVIVYEMDHCPYCRDFRDFYWPRLERDFGERIAIRFLPADSAAWVRRSPTIAIEGGSVFEGLPLRYDDLRKAVAESLASRG